MHDYFRPGSQPEKHELRVVERDGKRWLQQYRMPPDGKLWEHAWVDVVEVPWPPSNITPMRRRKGDHLCNRNGKPCKVMDETDLEIVVRTYPTCSVCGVPQVVR